MPLRFFFFASLCSFLYFCAFFFFFRSSPSSLLSYAFAFFADISGVLPKNKRWPQPSQLLFSTKSETLIATSCHHHPDCADPADYPHLLADVGPFLVFVGWEVTRPPLFPLPGLCAIIYDGISWFVDSDHMSYSISFATFRTCPHVSILFRAWWCTHTIPAPRPRGFRSSQTSAT